MRWIGLNAFGAACWIAGLGVATRFAPSLSGLGGDHPLVPAFCLAIAGLAVMLWANLSGGTERS